MKEERHLQFESFLDGLTDEWSSWFDEQKQMIEEHEQLFEKELDNRRITLTHSIEKWMATVQKERTSLLQFLRQIQKEAEMIIGQIRGHSLAHFHHEVANRYAKYTFLWQGIALLSFVCWVTYAFFFSIDEWKSHLLMMSLFGVFTTYTVKRAQHFSQIEYYHRALATILQTIDIYVATLPSRDQQQMKQRLFQQIFSFYHQNETFSPDSRKKD